MILSLELDFIHFLTKPMPQKFKSQNRVHASPYSSATEAEPLRRLMRTLGLPKDSVFVDLGSGKGRFLLIAAQFGFKKTIGVEFSPELCEIARANIRTFLRRTRMNARIEVVEGDVAKYAIKPEYNVLFMFRPFDAVVLGRFLANLRDSLEQFPRKVWLIYNNPIHGHEVASSGLFSACQEFKADGTLFKVYHS